MGTHGVRLGRTIEGPRCQKCGSTERYRDTKDKSKPGQCAPCARRLAKQRSDLLKAQAA